jgi:hypothetical protein
MKMSMRQVQLIGIDGKEFDRAQVPKDTPEFVCIGPSWQKRFFTWDKKSETYRELKAYNLPMPYMVVA